MIFPVLNLTQFIEQKNAFALRSGSWLHDPDISIVRFVLHFFELICKDNIFSRQNVCLRIKVIVPGLLIFALPFKYLFGFFEMFYQKIFPAQFKVIFEMIDLLVRC